MTFHDRRAGGWPRQLTQRYELELRGSYYYVVDMATTATVSRGYKRRETAQRQADRLERMGG